MKQEYKFPSVGITANQMLEKMGVKTIQKFDKKYLVYNRKLIPRPPIEKLEEVLNRDFGIKITYTE